jgi:hypothetical protein
MIEISIGDKDDFELNSLNNLFTLINLIATAAAAAVVGVVVVVAAAAVVIHDFRTYKRLFA